MFVNEQENAEAQVRWHRGETRNLNFQTAWTHRKIRKLLSLLLTIYFEMDFFFVLPRLVLDSWAQVILPSQPPK
jgi:hypothetical protein